MGYVGTACAKALLLRGSCSEIVFIDLPSRENHTRGVRNDLSHGEPLCQETRLVVGGYDDLHDASVVVITAGINEKEGGAIDPKDQWGRQRLLSSNAKVYREIIPKIVSSMPGRPIVVVTDPPDTLAQIALDEISRLGATNSVLSTGTFLDTLRLRVQIAEALGCSARSVDAYVLGEHGKTQVYAWSTARVGGIPLEHLVEKRWESFAKFQDAMRSKVIDANIDIIRATDASQHGIGIVTARIVEAILRDEQFVAPVATWVSELGVPLSLPCVIGRQGASVLGGSAMVNALAERDQLRNSSAYIGEALRREREIAATLAIDPSWESSNVEALQREREREIFGKKPVLTWPEWAEISNLPHAD